MPAERAVVGRSAGDGRDERDHAEHDQAHRRAPLRADVDAGRLGHDDDHARDRERQAEEQGDEVGRVLVIPLSPGRGRRDDRDGWCGRRAGRTAYRIIERSSRRRWGRSGARDVARADPQVEVELAGSGARRRSRVWLLGPAAVVAAEELHRAGAGVRVHDDPDRARHVDAELADPELGVDRASCGRPAARRAGRSSSWPMPSSYFDWISERVDRAVGVVADAAGERHVDRGGRQRRDEQQDADRDQPARPSEPGRQHEREADDDRARRRGSRRREVRGAVVVEQRHDAAADEQQAAGERREERTRPRLARRRGAGAVGHGADWVHALGGIGGRGGAGRPASSARPAGRRRRRVDVGVRAGRRRLAGSASCRRSSASASAVRAPAVGHGTGIAARRRRRRRRGRRRGGAATAPRGRRRSASVAHTTLPPVAERAGPPVRTR